MWFGAKPCQNKRGTQMFYRVFFYLYNNKNQFYLAPFLETKGPKHRIMTVKQTKKTVKKTLIKIGRGSEVMGWKLEKVGSENGSD